MAIPPNGPRHSRRGGPDREHMRIRRILFDLVREIVQRDQLNYSLLAQCIRTSEPRAHSLIKGHIERFNSETLIDILTRLGVDVDIVVKGRRPYVLWNLTRTRPGWRPPPGFAHG
jgi:predicted XRE-type DNA-binding protein